jgi:tetratricopeptide (TPR) repeat protein
VLRTVVPGQLAVAIERVEGAKAALDSLLLNAPKDLAEWHALQIMTAGRLTTKLAGDDAALDLYEKSFDPDFSRPSRLQVENEKICKGVLAWLARYWKTKNMSLGVSLLRLLRDVMKEIETPRSALPDLYFEHGLHTRAAELYRWCVAVDRDDVGAWVGLVTTLRLQDDPAAEEFLEVALEIFPQHAELFAGSVSVKHDDDSQVDK